MIDKRILAVVLSFVMLNLLGCRSVEQLTSSMGFSQSKSISESNAIAKRMIEESLRKQVLTKDNPGINKDVTFSELRSSDASTTRLASYLDGAPDESRNIKTVRFQSPSTEIDSSYPIDFPTVLRLAGADNWNVRLARQRVNEAAADYCAAKSEWMPSITLSLGFNNHEGEIQGTEGNVITASRNSLFLGAGAGIQNAPLNGGSGGPPRMFVDFSLADAIFKPLSARRLLGAEQARKNRVFNDTMLKASLAYYDLVRSQSQLAIAQTNLSEAEEVARLTASFVQAGKGTSADNSRIAVIANSRRQQIVAAEAELRIASARLATILQLDSTKLNPEMGLVALDADPVPVNMTGAHFDLNTTIQQAQNLRCEIAEANARTRSAHSEMMAEQWRPWLPNLYLGYSGGVFGGGTGGDLPRLDGRSDLDIVVSWQVKNLGVGTRAQQDATRSRMYQRNFEVQQIRDQIAEQVNTTHQRVNQYQAMLGMLAENIQQAGSGLEKNLAAIKGLEGLPLEAISSLDQLAKARTEYLSAVVNYNQWQVRLLRAAGQSLAADAELGTIANCDVTGCSVSVPDCPACFKRPSRCRCNRAISNRIGLRGGYFQSNSCTDGSCGVSPQLHAAENPTSRPNIMSSVGVSFLDRFSSTQPVASQPPRLSIGSSVPPSWYQQSGEFLR